MAGRPSSRKVLDVWMNGEFVGHWTFAPAGGHSFSYDSSWLENPQWRPLSLSLPLSQGTAPFSGSVVESYFDNLLPDSLGIRKRLASKFGTGSTQAFQLLVRIPRHSATHSSMIRPPAPRTSGRISRSEATQELQVKVLV